MPDFTAKMLSADVRSEMLRRGITRRDLAHTLGFAAQTITDVLAGTKKSRRARQGIEEVLGRPFWSSSEEFASRHSASANSQPTASANP